MTKSQYVDAKKIMADVQRLPVEAQRAILTMLRGAIVISDMYGENVLSMAEQLRAEQAQDSA